MKKQVYFTIIGIGALLAIIGFIPDGMSGLWGILIAGVAGAVYYFNTRNEKKVQERLEEEQNAFGQSGPQDEPSGSDESPGETDSSDESTQ